MNNEIKEFFEKNPGKTLVDYYQQRAAKISSSNSEVKSHDSNWDAGTPADKRSRATRERSYYQEAEKGLNKAAKTQLLLSSIGILCFFLPWFSVSTPFNSLSVTAADLLSRQEGPLLLLIFPIAFLANALIITYKKHELIRLRNVLFVIPFVYILVKVYQIISMAGSIDNTYTFGEIISAFTSNLGSSATFGIGMYGTFLCLILILFFSSGIEEHQNRYLK